MKYLTILAFLFQWLSVVADDALTIRHRDNMERIDSLKLAAVSTTDTIPRILLLNEMSREYMKLLMRAPGLTHANEAVALVETLGDSLLIVQTYSVRGGAYPLHGAAREYIDKGIAIAERHSDENEEWQRIASKLYAQLALYLRRQEKNEEALLYYNKCFELASELKDTVLMCEGMHGQGDLFWRMKRYDSMKVVFEKAHYLKRISGALDYSTYNNMSVSAQVFGEHERSIQYLDTAAKYVNRSYDNLMLYLNKTTALKEMGRFEEALMCADSIDKYRIEMANNNAWQTGLQMQEKFESKKKQHAIDQLEKENEISRLQIAQRNTMIILGSLMIIVIAAFLYIMFMRRKAQTKARLTGLELAALKAQINPHFLFNALGSVQNFIMKEDPLKAASHLSKLSRLLRLILQNSMDAFTSVETEVETLTNYLEIEQVRFDNKFDFEVNYPSELNLIQIPTMILQPFVENAIIHGTEETTDAFIEITLEESGDHIKATITDNGPGYLNAREKDSDHKSVGITITSERLKLLNENNFSDSNIKMTDRSTLNKNETGTIVVVLLPIKTA